MRNNTPTAPTAQPGHGRPRNRPAKGIGVPVTLWLPPAETGPETPLTQPAVLPAWALRRVADEYAKPGENVLAADTRDFYAGRRQIAFHPLAAHHDPHPQTRPGNRRPPARLAVLEIDTPSRSAVETAYPHQHVNLVTDFVRPALRAAADRLAPGGVLAIALSAPEPGHAAQRNTVVLQLARDAGFTYQQHIAVLTADLADDRIVARLTDAQARAVNTARRHGIPATAPAHLDLAIFTLPQENTRA